MALCVKVGCEVLKLGGEGGCLVPEKLMLYAIKLLTGSITQLMFGSRKVDALLHYSPLVNL